MTVRSTATRCLGEARLGLDLPVRLISVDDDGEMFARLQARRLGKGQEKKLWVREEIKMRTLLMVVSLTGFIAAVSGQAAHQKADNQATGKDSAKLSTITGCVAQSGALYRLDQAIIGTDPDVDTQNRPSPEASRTPITLSYALVGAELKAHLGHKVEVTGTITSDKTSKDTTAMKGIPGMKTAGTLNVKSVKMVAETCP